MALALSAANIAGAVTVFVFLGFVVPQPSEVAYDWGLLRLNLAIFAPGLVVVTVVANIWGPRLAAPVRAWFLSGRAPEPHEQALTLRVPLRQLKLSAGIWGGGLILFTTVNAFVSLRLAAIVALTLALGGLISCALTYLLAERLGRDVAAAALASGVPAEPAGPGVEVRVVLAWALVAGIPLFGGVMLAIAVFTGADVSAEQLARTVLFLGAFGLVLGLLATRVAARSVADPLESIRSAVRAVQGGDLRAEVSVYDGSEIGLLQAGFNHMVAGLRERERLQDLFGRHVGEAVAQRALDRGVELGGEVRDCAALFVDVVGSTRLAARRPAPEVVALLNRFFAAVVEATHAQAGWVNKFEGDAALCVFGVPLDSGDAATRALRAARELQGRLHEEVPELRGAIGVSFGSAVAGNVGAAERFEYTVIGDPVNEAARLCELAKARPTRILASETILRAADPVESARWRLGESITVRGRTTPTRIAEPTEAER